MTEKKTGTATRTRTVTAPAVVQEDVAPEYGYFRTLWRYPIWSTRRVVVVTLALGLIASNPANSMTVVNWGISTVQDWNTSAQAHGMYGDAK